MECGCRGIPVGPSCLLVIVLLTLAVGGKAQEDASPTPMVLGNTERFELGLGASRVFQIALPAGCYQTVFDVRLVDRKPARLLSRLSIHDEDGAISHENAIRLEEYGSQHRAIHTLSLDRPREIRFQVTHETGAPAKSKGLYWLTVVEPIFRGQSPPSTAATTAPSTRPDENEAFFRLVPFFGESIPRWVSLHKSRSGFLKRGRYAYYAIHLSPGRYKVALEHTDSDSFASETVYTVSLRGDLSLLDGCGRFLRHVVSIESRDWICREVSELSISREGTYIVRVNNLSRDSIHYLFRITPKSG